MQQASRDEPRSLIEQLRMLLADVPARADAAAVSAWHIESPAVLVPGNGWYRCASGLDFRIDRIDGTPRHLAAQDLPAAAAALDAADPVLRQLSARLGLAFEPDSMAEAAGEGAVTLSLADAAPEDAAHRVTIAITPGTPAAAQIAAAWAALPEALQAAQTPCALLLAGPALRMEDVAGLEPGDLLLLPAIVAARINPLAPDGATAGPFDAAMLDGALDLARGLFYAAAPVPDAKAAVGGFVVSPVLLVPDIAVATQGLARLQPGTALALPALAGTGQVRMLVGETVVAEGQLGQGPGGLVFLVDEAKHAAVADDLASATAPDAAASPAFERTD